MTDADADAIDTSDMDPRWVAYLREHCGPHCYGDQNEDGIDLSLIRENLKLTPTQRIRAADRATSDAIRLRRHARRAV